MHQTKHLLSEKERRERGLRLPTFHRQLSGTTINGWHCHDTMATLHTKCSVKSRMSADEAQKDSTLLNNDDTGRASAERHYRVTAGSWKWSSSCATIIIHQSPDGGAEVHREAHPGVSPLDRLLGLYPLNLFHLHSRQVAWRASLSVSLHSHSPIICCFLLFALHGVAWI